MADARNFQFGGIQF